MLSSNAHPGYKLKFILPAAHVHKLQAYEIEGERKRGMRIMPYIGYSVSTAVASVMFPLFVILCVSSMK